MRIPDETIERIKQAADIVEVVGDFVSLKKRGSNYTACCPFHNEKTPSFNVNPARQIYKCFGCGKAGDPVRFVMDIENLGYGEALRFLAKKYAIEIVEQETTPEEVVRQNERESLYIALNFAKDFYRDTLLKTDEGKSIGLSYFRERGFSDPTVAAFDLGYSPDSWDALMTAAQQRGYNLDILDKAGLVVKKEESGKVFDRFRARVIFPIHNVSGRVIAFGARILKPDPKSPKYLNSPETEVYHKSQVLYGIFQAKQAIRQEDVCYLTEGYTDVISLHQAGIKNVVASSGTSLTLEQIRLIGRFTPNVTILYDGDAAGIKAALRGLDMVLEEGLNVSIATFPNGEDPDSYVRRVGAEAFKAYLKEHTQDFISFKTDALLRDAGDSPFRLAEVISDVVESITRIPDAIKRQVFFRTTAQKLKTDEQTLISESNRLLRQRSDQRQKDQDRAASRPRVEPGRRSAGAPGGSNNVAPDEPDIDGLLADAGITSSRPVNNVADDTSQSNVAALAERSATSRPPLALQEEECLRLLLNYGDRELEPGISLTHYILDELGEILFQHSPFATMLAVIREAFSQGDLLTADHFLRHDDEATQHAAINLTTPRWEISQGWQKHEIVIPQEDDQNDQSILARAAYTNLLRLKKLLAEQQMTALMQGIRTATDPDETDRLMREYMQLKQIDVQIAQRLGTVISG